MVTKKPLELPPAVARGFVSAMRDYFAETDTHKCDSIASYQLSIMKGYQGPREKPLTLEGRSQTTRLGPNSLEQPKKHNDDRDGRDQQ